MSVDRSPLGLTAALERLAALELRSQSMESVLQTVVDLTVQVLPGTSESSITLVVDGRPPYVAVAVANVRDYQSAREMAANLQVALESRAVIDQAKGVLMERHEITADQAFQALVQVSMRSNRRVRDIADLLVQSGEFAMPPA